MIGILLVFVFFIFLYVLYIKDSENDSEDSRKKYNQRIEMVEEFKKLYRSFNTKQLAEELEKTAGEYMELIEQAQNVYRQRFPNENVYDYNRNHKVEIDLENGGFSYFSFEEIYFPLFGFLGIDLIDKSYYIREEINFPLQARRTALESIMIRRLKYGDNIHADNYSINSKILYEDKVNGKKYKIKYTGRIDFDFNGELAFFYDSETKDIIPIKDYICISYDDIISVEAKDNSLVFKIDNKELKSIIPTNINCDFKETKKYLIFELETATPKEIEKIIDRRMEAFLYDVEEIEEMLEDLLDLDYDEEIDALLGDEDDDFEDDEDI